MDQKKTTQILSLFFQQSPFFFYSLSALLGVSFHFTHSFSLFFLFPLLIFPFLKEGKISKIFISILFTFCFYAYASFLYPEPVTIKNPIRGVGYLSISSITPSSAFQKRLLYKGTLLSFRSKDSTYQLKNIPCQIYYKEPFSSRPKASHEYLIEGTLCPINPFLVLLKVSPKSWSPQKKVFSLVEWRFQAKTHVKEFLQTILFHKPSDQFLSALVTGDLDDAFLKFSFAKLGLQHILAISGFHFGILISCVSILLFPFFSYQKIPWILLFLVNGYFLFLGASPSIQRAWISIQFVLIGKILNQRNFSMNALGFSLLMGLLLDPLSVLNIGFQLSFLSTACILMVFTRLDFSFSSWIQNRDPKELFPLSFLGYKILILIRQSLCLSLVVNIAVVPVVLFHFHKFPLLGFLYNLFFPALIGVCLFCLLVTLLSHALFFPFTSILDGLVTYLTKFSLDFVSYPPSSLQCYIRVPSIPFSFLVSFLILIFFFFLLFQNSSPKSSTKKISFL